MLREPHNSDFRSRPPTGGAAPTCNRRWTLALLAGAMAAAYPLANTHGQASEAVDLQREYNVKAVSLYAFGRYVTWPDAAFASKDSPVVLGVLGGNPFGDALDRIAAKKTLNGRPMVIKQLAGPQELAGAHIVFVTRAVTPEVESAVLQATDGKPVLVVGETPGFAERGGIVNFFLSGANIRFELNPERGAACQLHLDAKLLSLGAKAQLR